MQKLASVLLIRPENVGQVAVLKLKQLGFNAVCLPFSQIKSLKPIWPKSTPTALLATSANAFTTAITNTPALKRLPLYCVGNKTAVAAKAQGFTNIQYKASNVEDLCRFLVRLETDSAHTHQCWFYLAGKPRRPILEKFLQSQQMPFELIEVYNSVIITPSKQQLDMLAKPLDYVLLYSAQVIKNLPILNWHITAQTKFLCLSPRIAAVIPSKWQTQTLIAETPTETSLFQLLNDDYTTSTS